MNAYKTGHKLQHKHAIGISETLQHYNDKLAQTISYLEEERASIGRRDFEKLQETLGNKESLLAQISELETKLFKILKPYNINKDSIHSFNELLNEYQGPMKQKIETLWSSTQNLLSKCNQLNQINEKVISHSKTHLSRLISILKGVELNVKTYKKNGYTQPESSCRVLAKA